MTWMTLMSSPLFLNLLPPNKGRYHVESYWFPSQREPLREYQVMKPAGKTFLHLVKTRDLPMKHQSFLQHLLALQL